MKIVLRLSAMIVLLGAIIFLPTTLQTNNTSAAVNKIILSSALILGMALLLSIVIFVFIKIKNQ